MLTIEEDILPQAGPLGARPAAPVAIVIHTTGSGLTEVAAKKAGAKATPGALDDAVRAWYRKSGFQFFGHYLVGTSGRVWRLAADEKKALHAAALSARYDSDWLKWAHPQEWKEEGPHRRPAAKVYDWWQARWPTLRSPTQLATGKRPNDSAIGVDLLPTTQDTFTPAQVESCARLVRSLCERWHIPADRAHVLGHEDVDPMRRGTMLAGTVVRGIPWDPGAAFDWPAFMALVAAAK